MGSECTKVIDRNADLWNPSKQQQCQNHKVRGYLNAVLGIPEPSHRWTEAMIQRQHERTLSATRHVVHMVNDARVQSVCSRSGIATTLGSRGMSAILIWHRQQGAWHWMSGRKFSIAKDVAIKPSINAYSERIRLNTLFSSRLFRLSAAKVLI